jgi:CspA family cold shock protein
LLILFFIFMSDNTQTGEVKFFNSEKGFGFIKNQNKDIFFHINDCNNIADHLLVEGTNLSFETGEDKRGRVKATNITLAS